MKMIAAALAKAQTEMGPALKESINPAFKSKYADLASVLAACLPALNKNGIAMIQPTGEDEMGRYVKTILIHDSGETLECRVPLIIGKNDMQGYGSAVTYARRYGAMSMSGVAPDDDDGNAAVANGPQPARQISAAIQDARDDAILDAAPDNATPRQKAEAAAKLIREDFKGKGLAALNARWTHWQKHIDRLKDNHADLHETVVDAYEIRRNELTAGDMAMQAP